MAKQQKFYAVKAGRMTGIFTTWADCKTQVDGFTGAKYKSFSSAVDAANWLTGRSIKNPGLPKPNHRQFGTTGADRIIPVSDQLPWN